MKYLVTGATGFLGQHLVIELLRAGHSLVLLARSKNGMSAKERVEQQFVATNTMLNEHVVQIVEADMHDDVSLILSKLAECGSIDGVWHLAANLSFKKKKSAEVIRDNVFGTKQYIALCGKLGAKLFFVSTAYVHGMRSGLIKDTELIRPRAFNNAYEESKFLSEEYIRDWGKNHAYTVFRPGILISLNKDRNSYFGYYVMAYALGKFRAALVAFSEQHRFLLSLMFCRYENDIVHTSIPFPIVGKCVVDFVPVEWVVEWMVKLAETAPDKQTFHLSNPQPFRLRYVVEQISAASKIKLKLFRSFAFLNNVYFLALQCIGFFIPTVASFSRKLVPYSFYVTAVFTHDMTHTEAYVGDLSRYTVSDDTLVRIAQEYIASTASPRSYIK